MTECHSLAVDGPAAPPDNAVCAGWEIDSGATSPGPLIRTVIIDDEPLARQRLRDLLSPESDIEVVAEFRNGRSAIRELAQVRPDVLFLDVEMPRISGFDVVAHARDHCAPTPYIVFVTAFDQYALRAFDEEASDYLLKPFDKERFARTLARIRRHPMSRVAEDGAAVKAAQYYERLAVRSGSSTRVIRVEDVCWIESAGNYVRLHIERQSYLFRATMNAIENRLDPRKFIRIARSTIVRIDRIVQLHSGFRGNQIVELEGGVRLTLNVQYRHNLRARVQGL